MKALILKSYDYFSKNRLVFRLVLVVAFGLPAALASRVSFEEDISRMLQMDSKTQEYRKLIQNTRLVDKLVLCIADKTAQTTAPEVKMAYCDSLVKRLQTIDSSLVRKITHTPADFPYMDVYQALLRNLPFFTEEIDYAGFDSLFTPDQLQRHLAQKTRQLSSLTGLLVQKTLPLDPAGISEPLTLRLKALGDAGGYETVNGYFFTKDKKNLVLFVEPANPANETGKNSKLISAIEDFSDELSQQASFSQLECSYFGATAMSVGNARQIQRDTVVTLLVMCFVLILLISSVFRRLRTPFIIFLPVVFGLLFSLAVISLFKESISLIAIGATSVLLGIAVNYPIHILSHRMHDSNLRRVIADLVEPMTIGSATTIGGFACLFFVRAEILHDFGLLGAFGLIGAVMFSLIFMPHLIGRQESKASSGWLGKTANLKFESNPYLIWLVILLTPVFLYFAQFIRFDSDLMNLNYVAPRLAKTESILRGNETRRHPVYMISYGKNPDQALASAVRIKSIADSLRKSGMDIRYTGTGGFLLPAEEQAICLARWKKYFTPEKIEQIRNDLTTAGRKAGFKDTAFTPFFTTLEHPSHKIDSTDNELLMGVFGRETVHVTSEMTTIVSVLSIPAGSRTEVEKLLENQPDARMIDNKYLSDQLASIITADFNFIALFTSVLVFVALLLTYGRIELALAAFLPMVVSWIWILGLMGLSGIHFNIVNIILSTFIFGLGDDYCIFTMDGMLQGYRNKRRQLPVVRTGIILSGLTAFIGFGSMIIARHPALQSIALVSVIGITSVLLISQILIPFIFNTFVTRPISKGASPLTLAAILKILAAYLSAGLLYLLVCVTGILFLVVGISGKQKGLQQFNRVLRMSASVLLRLTMPVRYGTPGAMKKPLPAGLAVVAGYHPLISHLTVLTLNRGIQVSCGSPLLKLPVFGFLLKRAGHVQRTGTASDAESLIQAARSGKTAVVFALPPAPDDRVRVFQHADVIELANKNRIGIIPVVLYQEKKTEGRCGLHVSDDILSVQVSESMGFIPKPDLSFDFPVADAIRRYLLNEWQKSEGKPVSPADCRQRLINNYLFKGAALENHMRSLLRTENNFETINSLTPASGTVFVEGSGYGFLPFMLACCSPGRMVTGYEPDPEKHDTAVNGFNLPANLRFIKDMDNNDQTQSADCLIVFNEAGNRNSFDNLSGFASRLSPEGTLIFYSSHSGRGKSNLASRILFPLLRLIGLRETKLSPGELPPVDEISLLIEKSGLIAVPFEQTSDMRESILLFRQIRK